MGDATRARARDRRGRRLPAQRGARPESICKRDSVGAGRRLGSHSSGPPVARRLERPYPGASDGPPAPCSVLLRVGFAKRPPSPASLVSSYLTVSPLPAASFPKGRRSPFCCTFPVSRRAAVSGHPALWSPDFPLTANARAAASDCPIDSGRRFLLCNRLRQTPGACARKRSGAARPLHARRPQTTSGT